MFSRLFKRVTIAVALLLSAVLATGSPASAQSAYGPRLVHLSVVDRDSGQTQQVYFHDRRYFVAGQTGRRYSLRIENTSNERVLVVLSVDGVNVISGETADFNQRGYILAPHESGDINGWRKSETEIAVFRFAPLPQSYAARTGRAGDVGVIGMAVFRERRVPPPPPPIWHNRWKERRGDTPSAMPPPPPSPPVMQPGSMGDVSTARANQDATKAMPAPSEKLGTAHGEIEHDVSHIAPFERASWTPDAVRLLEYDSTENLVAAGVI
ncbi:hypothetical protein, partial [Sphingomonas sp.]|uniref:hypothetical protein n=1 Tax=Sphingomonas sp. TaxID=28214 RepID=UPI00375279DF